MFLTKMFKVRIYHHPLLLKLSIYLIYIYIYIHTHTHTLLVKISIPFENKLIIFQYDHQSVESPSG